MLKLMKIFTSFLSIPSKISNYMIARDLKYWLSMQDEEKIIEILGEESAKEFKRKNKCEKLADQA